MTDYQTMLAGISHFEQRCKENRDPYCMAYIERQGREVERDNKRFEHSPSWTPPLIKAADLERTWGLVATALEVATGHIEAADFGLDADQQECLRDAAVAIQPYKQTAFALRQKYGTEYTALYKQRGNAGLPGEHEGGEVGGDRA